MCPAKWKFVDICHISPHAATSGISMFDKMAAGVHMMR
jgi:hypothetical protein